MPLTGPVAPRGQTPRDARILVVEDDPSVRELIGWALEDEGLPAVAVADGRAAIDWLSKHRPAAVLLDIDLPIVDGFGVAEALRVAHGPGVPVVVMTAGSRAAESARRIGARDFLAKPFDVDEMLNAVGRALGR